MRYGSLEYAYAAPFANALRDDSAFREWLLGQTRFADRATGATLLDHEMSASRRAGTWWRSHYTERCRCEGCSGQETDVLAIFAATDSSRFALHVEVKQPTDRFPAHKDQARNYALRARCWANNAPPSVPSHEEADTMLLFGESRRSDFALHIAKFGSALTFEEIGCRFHHATCS